MARINCLDDPAKLPAQMKPHPSVIANAGAILDGYRVGRSLTSLASEFGVSRRAVSRFRKWLARWG